MQSFENSHVSSSICVRSSTNRRAKRSSFDARYIARKAASVSFPVVVGLTLAMLIVSWLERLPVQVPPTDRGHPWECEYHGCPP